jgi:hypothetical protein
MECEGNWLLVKGVNRIGASRFHYEGGTDLVRRLHDLILRFSSTVHMLVPFQGNLAEFTNREIYRPCHRIHVQIKQQPL